MGVGWFLRMRACVRTQENLDVWLGLFHGVGGDPEPPRFQVLGERCLSRVPSAPPYPEVAVL